MTTFDRTINTSPGSLCPDCSPFLNWDEKETGSEVEKTVVLRSLIATLKLQPSFDVTLETKAVKLLESVIPYDRESADASLESFGLTTDDSLASFTQSIGVLLSSPNRAITITAMKMLEILFWSCSPKIRLALVNADLIPLLINNLNPQSLSITETADIHINLMVIISRSLRLSTPEDLRQLGIEDDFNQQADHETVFQQVLAPSEQYICHLCVNRNSIIDGEQSTYFLELLARLLEICPYYKATMEFILTMPSRSMVATVCFSFAASLVLLVCGGQGIDGWMVTIGGWTG
ncbi:hypothetical protein BLNAU_11099 [Blattamonas nauphoetae]|uniref:Uncharacterized protein n=1 Tax=Blattamonas nauphoetae TaxID=2049346 RepID=A0ABQ9XSH1_9EUKA|nr:hypothetical protein BLNAU_11099 [Blattamonas nauphoetae]